MDEKLQKKLFNKYPKIFKINNPAQFPFDVYKFESWDGWADLIDRTAAQIQKILDNDKDAYFYTIQNKQKMSGLRWYYECDEKHIKEYEKIIDIAERESLDICEQCGSTDKVSQNKKGYILTLCQNCRKKH